MTEEPHRSRRMAIMKKHPEVCAAYRLLTIPTSDDRGAGFQTYGLRTPHKMGGARSSLPASHGGPLPQEHFHDVARFPHHGLRGRCNCEPEFVPRNP